jgi:preprotein translocase subunit SecB
MKIGLVYNKAEFLQLERNVEIHKDEANKFHFDFEVSYLPEESNKFFIIFNLEIKHPGDFELKTQYISMFNTSENIDEEFKKSDFTLVNAPAIAFPFMRSFVATITLNAGYNPAILPSINFLEFKNRKTTN